MADWVLTAGMQNLRAQINAAFPQRDKASDGTIGDTAHQAETSDHNPDDTPGSRPGWDGDSDSIAEVRAIDVDSDLRDAGGVTMQDVIDHLRALPGLSTVIRYMIFNRKMYHADTGFSPVTYTGASPHVEHAHFSGARTQAADSNTTFDFKLEELAMNEQTIWDHNIGTAEKPQSADGAIITLLQRTDALANKLGPQALAQAASNGSALSALSSSVSSLLSRPVLDASALAATISEAVVSGVLAGLEGNTDEQVRDLIVGLYGAQRAHDIGLLLSA